MITAQQRKRFVAICEELNDLLREIRVKSPEANYYLAEDSLHLMKGESHSLGGKPIHANSVESVRIAHSGGGDW